MFVLYVKGKTNSLYQKKKRNGTKTQPCTLTMWVEYVDIIRGYVAYTAVILLPLLVVITFATRNILYRVFLYMLCFSFYFSSFKALCVFVTVVSVLGLRNILHQLCIVYNNTVRCII